MRKNYINYIPIFIAGFYDFLYLSESSVLYDDNLLKAKIGESRKDRIPWELYLKKDRCAYMDMGHIAYPWVIVVTLFKPRLETAST